MVEFDGKMLERNLDHDTEKLRVKLVCSTCILVIERTNCVINFL